MFLKTYPKHTMGTLPKNDLSNKGFDFLKSISTLKLLIHKNYWSDNITGLQKSSSLQNRSTHNLGQPQNKRCPESQAILASCWFMMLEQLETNNNQWYNSKLLRNAVGARTVTCHRKTETREHYNAYLLRLPMLKRPVIYGRWTINQNVLNKK